MDSTTAREIRKLQQRIGRVEPKAPGGECSCDYCEPLTNGDPAAPEIIFADGDVVMVCEVPS